MSAHELSNGDRLPHVAGRLPGRATRALASRIAACEAPGVNTLVGDTTASASTAMVWREALGANVLDVDGNCFVDMTSGFGVAGIGHRHPQVIAAADRQMHALVHGLGDVFSHPQRVALAERLVELSPIPDTLVYFAISGSDAVEIALKSAQLHTRRAGILSFDPAYHGTTLGALRACSRSAFRGPFVDSVAAVSRLPFGASEDRIDAELSAGDVAAVLVEPIVGREGVVLPPPRWLAQLREACRRHGSLLVADEIFVGLGRTGPWWVSQGEGAEVDLLCCGKALGGGWPIAAVLGRRPVMESWPSDQEALHTATFLAHPVACAAANATLDVLATLLPHEPRKVARGLAPLHEPARRAGFDVRGRGALWALQGQQAKVLQAALLQRGVLALAGGAAGDVLQFAPPLVITDQQLQAVVEICVDELKRLPRS